MYSWWVVVEVIGRMQWRWWCKDRWCIRSGERDVASLSDRRRSQQQRVERRPAIQTNSTAQPDHDRRGSQCQSRDSPATHLSAQNVRLRRRLHAQRLSRTCVLFRFSFLFWHVPILFSLLSTATVRGKSYACVVDGGLCRRSCRHYPRGRQRRWRLPVLLRSRQNRFVLYVFTLTKWTSEP